VNTQALPAPLNGTITIEDVRVAAADNPLVIGPVCVWGNPTGNSSGTISLNVLGGSGSATINLDLMATAMLSQELALPPVELKQSASLNLSGVSIQTLLNAANSGSADGLFATTTSFSGNATIAGFPATFNLNLAVTNESAPPLFDADLEAFCGTFFAQQFSAPPAGGLGTEPGLFYGINSKSDYLTVANGDNPAAPVVITLSDVFGATDPGGHTLRLTRVGTFADSTQLKNGGQTKVSGVFSSTNVVLGTNVQDRIPGALQSAAPAFKTPPVLQGFFIVQTDIPQDFLIDPGLDVVVPAGAKYLIVAPFSPDLTWGDNSGFSLGVALKVLN